MPSPNDEQEVFIKLAEMRQEMTSIMGVVTEIKSSVKEVVQLDRTIAELSIYHQQQAKEIQTQWSKIDLQQKDIDKVERKTDEFINRTRGALSIGAILGSAAQVAVLAMVGWTFNHIRGAEDDMIRMKMQLVQIENQINNQQNAQQKRQYQSEQQNAEKPSHD